MCLKVAQCESTFASTKQKNTLKQTDMNTENTLSFISSMISSEASYRTLVDMIDEMGLEMMDFNIA